LATGEGKCGLVIGSRVRQARVMKWLAMVLLAGLSASCMGVKATKHTYIGADRGAELGGAEVRVAFRPEGSRPGSVMVSAMVVGGGFAEFDGPFRWRVEALGHAGEHEGLVVHRIRTRTLKSGREEWYPASQLGQLAQFRPLKKTPQKVRARYPIPGLLRVMPEEDGGLEVWIDASILGPSGTTRRLLKFRMEAAEKDASEMIFLPAEIARGLTTKPEDWDDAMWD
jgi:hypothetical protein